MSLICFCDFKLYKRDLETPSRKILKIGLTYGTGIYLYTVTIVGRSLRKIYSPSCATYPTTILSLRKVHLLLEDSRTIGSLKKLVRAFYRTLVMTLLCFCFPANDNGVTPYELIPSGISRDHLCATGFPLINLGPVLRCPNYED